MMESKYQCPFCKYMSLKKWNVKKHVENIHGIKNYGNANIKRVNIDQQNMRQPEIHTKSECPIHTSQYRSIQEHQHDDIPHYQSKYQPSQEDHQYGKRFKDATTQYSENDINHSTIPLYATNTADQIIQEPQFSEYDRNVVEVLETKKRFFMDLCSLSKWDMIRHMISDQYINIIIEACHNLTHYDVIRRKPYYKYITILANNNEDVQYKRRILQEKGPEILYLINSLILPLIENELKNGKRFKHASTQYSENDINHSTIPLVVTNTADQIIQEKEAQLLEYDRNIYGDKSDENCKKRKPVVITKRGVFILE